MMPRAPAAMTWRAWSMSSIVHTQEPAKSKESDAADEDSGDDLLLNGPQMEGEANSQDDIDKLFD